MKDLLNAAGVRIGGDVDHPDVLTVGVQAVMNKKLVLIHRQFRKACFRQTSEAEIQIAAYMHALKAADAQRPQRLFIVRRQDDFLRVGIDAERFRQLLYKAFDLFFRVRLFSMFLCANRIAQTVRQIFNRLPIRGIRIIFVQKLAVILFRNDVGRGNRM